MKIKKISKIELIIENYIRKFNKVNNRRFLDLPQLDFGIFEPQEIFTNGIYNEIDGIQATYAINSNQTMSLQKDSYTEVSQTNLQEDGVLESDVFLNNEKYVVIKSKDNQITIYQFDKILEQIDTKNKEFQTLKEKKKIKFDNNIKEFLLYKDKIIVIEQLETPSYTNENILNKLSIISLKDKTVLNTMKLTGEVKALRVVKDNVYVINEFSPKIEITTNLKERKELTPLINGKKTSKKKNTNFMEINNNIKILNLIKLNINNYSYKYKNIIVDNIDTYYFSNKRFYLTSKNDKNTNIYSYKLKNLKLQSKVKIEGALLNKFSLHEYKEHLIVASTLNKSWSERENKLYLFDKKLNKKHSFSGYGQEGESIKGVRFSNDKAFIVTFKQTDPLYTFTFKNLEKIEYLGELKIPGYSQYLHNINDKLLFTIGKETDNNGIEKGMNAQIFNIEDLKNVRLTDKIIFEKVSTSAVIENQKNLLYRNSDNIIGFDMMKKMYGYSNDQENNYYLYKIVENKFLNLFVEENQTDEKRVLLTLNNQDIILSFLNNKIRIRKI